MKPPGSWIGKTASRTQTRPHRNLNPRETFQNRLKNQTDFMRILLCDRVSGLFFQGPQQWTSEARLARDFQNSPKAILYANEHALNGVEVYWDFGDPEYNVSLPITADATPMAA